MITFKTAAATFLMLAAGTSFAVGGEYHHRFHGVWQEGAVGVDGLPVHISGIGTFAGGITAVRFHGNGVYIGVAPGIVLAERPVIAPKAKIITVSDHTENDACSMEHDVCVIRAR